MNGEETSDHGFT